MFNNENGFVDKLRKAAEKNKNALFITASPDDAVETKKFADSIRRAAKLSDCDGSYLYSENGNEEILGEAYRICDGVIEPLHDAKSAFMEAQR